MGFLDQLKGLFQGMPSISTKELEGLLSNQKVTLLDVRTSNEFRQGHIKQAKHVPLDKIDTYNGPKTGTVYVICQSGMRSKMAARRLAAKGYDVVNVRGGMSAWSGPKSV